MGVLNVDRIYEVCVRVCVCVGVCVCMCVYVYGSECKCAGVCNCVCLAICINPILYNPQSLPKDVRNNAILTCLTRGHGGSHSHMCRWVCLCVYHNTCIARYVYRHTCLHPY